MMPSTLSTIVSLLAIVGIVMASPVQKSEHELEARAKPTGGPASMELKIYSGPYTCPSASSPVPEDGTAGTLLKTITIPEATCAITPFALTGVFTARLTAAPKTGAIGCYVQIFKEQGCGVTLTNQYHGYPFDSTTVGSVMACGNPVGFAYGAVEVVCE